MNKLLFVDQHMDVEIYSIIDALARSVADGKHKIFQEIHLNKQNKKKLTVLFRFFNLGCDASSGPSGKVSTHLKNIKVYNY